MEKKPYNPVAEAYKLVVGFHYHGKTTDFDEIIGYLGEALDDDPEYAIDETAEKELANDIPPEWPKENPHIPDSVKEAAYRMAERLKAAAYEHSGEPIAKVKDIIEEDGGITVVIEPNKAQPVNNEEDAAKGVVRRSGRYPWGTGDISHEEKSEDAAEFLNKTMHIKDSGDRTQFESGAVRDMREGKGRCDLMPLEVVARLFNEELFEPDRILDAIGYFQYTMNTGYLYRALIKFCEKQYHGFAPTMLLEVAKHFEEGARKYGENNWQKGIPVHCYIDSAVRHYLKWLRGDTDEPHDRAFVWNLMCCIWEVDYHHADVQ